MECHSVTGRLPFPPRLHSPSRWFELMLRRMNPVAKCPLILRWRLDRIAPCVGLREPRSYSIVLLLASIFRMRNGSCELGVLRPKAKAGLAIAQLVVHSLNLAAVMIELWSHVSICWMGSQAMACA